MPRGHLYLSRRPGDGVAIYDPIEYFILRYTLQAVLDYFTPSNKCTEQDLLTARQFVHSAEGQNLIAHFGVPVIQRRLT